MEYKNILYQSDNGILYLTLNRPDVKNALSPQMWDDISDAVRRAAEDGAIRVIILGAAGGKVFASGADIKEINERESLRQLKGRSSETLQALEQIPKPTICCIDGYALGGGCEVAMACDIRIATRRSKFGQPEVNLGIIPGAGGTQRLVRLVGAGKAKEMIFTGQIVSAEEAKNIGLVNRVVEDESALLQSAREIAAAIMQKGPVAIQLAKIAVNYGCETDLNTALMIERLAQTVAFSTQDRQEGTKAFLEKRQPEFLGR